MANKRSGFTADINSMMEAQTEANQLLRQSRQEERVGEDNEIFKPKTPVVSQIPETPLIPKKKGRRKKVRIIEPTVTINAFFDEQLHMNLSTASTRNKMSIKDFIYMSVEHVVNRYFPNGYMETEEGKAMVSDFMKRMFADIEE